MNEKELKNANFESLSKQISKTIPPGHYIICVMPQQNLNSDIMVEKIMNALPDGTTIFKLGCA